jgi:hypothetical protein
MHIRSINEITLYLFVDFYNLVYKESANTDFGFFKKITN